MLSTVTDVIGLYNEFFPYAGEDASRSLARARGVGGQLRVRPSVGRRR